MRYQQSTRRTISSAWTHFCKFVFPVIWIGFLSVPVLSEGPWILWFLSPLLILSAALYHIFVSPLKTVRIDDKAFYVSNYRKEIRIPFSQVDKVTDNRVMNTKPVTIHFRTETESGRRVVFMPTINLSSWMSSHPIADELRDLIRQGNRLDAAQSGQ